MERGLVDDFTARGAVPTKLIDAPRWPLLLNDDSNLHVPGQLFDSSDPQPEENITVSANLTGL